MVVKILLTITLFLIFLLIPIICIYLFGCWRNWDKVYDLDEAIGELIASIFLFGSCALAIYLVWGV